MSKLYDIKKIYAQDFGIAVTNAPSIAVKKSSNLLKNVFMRIILYFLLLIMTYIFYQLY